MPGTVLRCPGHFPAKNGRSAPCAAAKSAPQRTAGNSFNGYGKQKTHRRGAFFVAKGAACRAAEDPEGKAALPFTCICDGRLKTTVSMNVLHRGQETNVTVAAAGDCWYDRVSVIDVIPDRQKTVDFIVTSVDSKKKRMISIPLEGFPKRPDRTTRVQIRILFLDERTMEVTLQDRGFGELFPASGVQIRQEVML